MSTGDVFPPNYTEDVGENPQPEISDKQGYATPPKTSQVQPENPTVSDTLLHTRVNPQAKPNNEPYLIIHTGQSNATSYLAPVEKTDPKNSKVFDWTDLGDGTGTFAWHPINPDYTRPAMTAPIVGNPGSASNAAHVFGDLLQRATGNDVYVFSVISSGTSIDEWKDTGTVDAAFETHVADAIAAIPNAPSAADAILWMQGEADINSKSEYNYFIAFGEYLAQAASPTQNYYNPDKTKVLVTELLPNYGNNSTLRNLVVTHNIAERNDNFRLISTNDLEFSVDYYWDTIAWHMLADGAIRLGQRAFTTFLNDKKEENNDPFKRNVKRTDINIPIATTEPVLVFTETVPSYHPFDATGPKTTYTVIIEFAVNGHKTDYSKRWQGKMITTLYFIWNTSAGTAHYEDRNMVYEYSTEVPPSNTGISLGIGDSVVFGPSSLWGFITSNNAEDWVFSYEVNYTVFVD